MTEAQLQSYWRELTGERDTTTPITNANISLHYLQPAAEDLNRRCKYFYKETAVTVVAATQEYAQPSDCIEIIFVQLGDELLAKTDIQQLKQQEPNWQSTEDGIPESYYVYGGKIGFFPTPNAAAAALTCTVRHVATPTISTTPGFDLLATHDHKIPVLRAAQYWFEAHGWDYQFQRAQRFEALYEKEAQRIEAFYADRKLQRGP